MIPGFPRAVAVIAVALTFLRGGAYPQVDAGAVDCGVADGGVLDAGVSDAEVIEVRADGGVLQLRLNPRGAGSWSIDCRKSRRTCVFDRDAGLPGRLNCAAGGFCVGGWVG